MEEKDKNYGNDRVLLDELTELLAQKRKLTQEIEFHLQEVDKKKTELRSVQDKILTTTDRIKGDNSGPLSENDNVDTPLPESLPKKGIVKELFVILSEADEAMSAVDLYEALQEKGKKASLNSVRANLSVHKDLFQNIMKKDLTQGDNRKPGWVIKRG